MNVALGQEPAVLWVGGARDAFGVKHKGEDQIAAIVTRNALIGVNFNHLSRLLLLWIPYDSIPSLPIPFPSSLVPPHEDALPPP